MKRLITVLSILGILVVAFTVTNVSAQSSQPGGPTLVTVTPMPQTGNPGMRGGMMGSGRMGARNGARGNMMGSGQMNTYPGMMQGQTGKISGSGYGLTSGTMMAGVTPMHDDVASYLGMTTQDLYNHMAAGKSMAQIAAEKGISEQQLMNSILMGRQNAYNQAVRSGYMTQAQANAMLQNMSSSLKTMINGQGVGSKGWGMMWGMQATPAVAP